MNTATPLICLGFVALLAGGCSRSLVMTVPIAGPQVEVGGVALLSVVGDPALVGQTLVRFPPRVAAADLRLDSAGDVAALAADGAGVRITLGVVRMEEKPVRIIHEHLLRDGGPARIERQVYLARRAVATMTVSVFRRDGSTLIKDWELEATAIADPDPSARRRDGQWLLGEMPVTVVETDAVAVEGAALDAAIDRILQRLAPVSSQAIRIPFDRSDSAQRGTLERATNGDHQGALREQRRYAKEHPTNAAAAYNLAVMLDGTNSREEALEWYGRALGLDPKPAYQRQLAACRERLARFGR